MLIKDGEQEKPGTNESEQEELTPEQLEEKEYDKAFDEELPEDKKKEKKKSEESDEEKAEREKAEQEKADNEKAEADKKAEEEKKAAESSEQKPDESPDGIRKALKDTKAWGTKVAQENAELRRTIQEYNAGKATATDVAKAQAVRDDANKDLKVKLVKVYEDYPELKDVFEPMLAITENVQSKLSDIEKIKSDMELTAKQAELKARFERDVEPEVLKVHPEFATIKHDKAYYDWAETQSPAMKYAATVSLDPKDLIQAVGEFKKFVGSDKFKSAQEKEDEAKADIKKNASTLRGGGSRKIEKAKSTKIEDVDKDDYNGGWDASPDKKVEI